MKPLRRPCCGHVSVRRSRAAGFLGWIVPGMLLLLIPKCPVCFAAYVALAGGIGLSLPVAAAVRTGLIASCVAALVFLAARPVCRRFGGWRRAGTNGRGGLRSNHAGRRSTLRRD